MNKLVTFSTAASLLTLAACATSPLDEQRRMDMEADIDDILSYELDPLEYGEVRTCLSDSEVRGYRPLGKRHLLFTGRQGRQWVNTLRGTCPGLDDFSTFIMKPKLGGQLCDKDRFEVIDQFGSLSRAGTYPTCALGEFKPVTEAQVEEVRNRLEMR